jgi:hypothetical protein
MQRTQCPPIDDHPTTPSDRGLPGPGAGQPLKGAGPSTAAAFAAVTCGNGGLVIWGIRGSRLAIKCV